MKLEWVLKRDGSLVAFDDQRITQAIYLAAKQTGEFEQIEARELANKVKEKLRTQTADVLSVELIQDYCEEVLLSSVYKQTAKAFILYREKRKINREKNIFKPRLSLKPYEYKDLVEYVDAIRHSYWIHTEFNYTSDIQDFKVLANNVEQEAIRRSMLAIAQIEVSVKTFWGDIFKHLPKPEIGSVGYTFAESEVRHHDAYSHLLELLGLNDAFETISSVPAMIKRINYLDYMNQTSKQFDEKSYTISILLFSLFIEHVSLFSQFLIIMSFNKYQNRFKGISNVIEATSKEEQIHGLFGIDVVNIIKQENPTWFDESMSYRIKKRVFLHLKRKKRLLSGYLKKVNLSFYQKKSSSSSSKTDSTNRSFKSVNQPYLILMKPWLVKPIGLMMK
ncbi:Ribonucleoside-diphosphate reductase, beta subunit [Paracholeplasma brassicae]|uniref:ribonucleoside-diphosphate reductase n=1 Tax=Acholeplasma brassicae TaxID=61635 RepID=U4KQE8_9MOLU|nr:ribonucleotide-diphosphate reductase subunit beta [Paracholeplasma brassicae]CCV66685.1 Ribonucleoside-diphosphate reductase, beta subunit [Paracholeplasma brassicae]